MNVRVLAAVPAARREITLRGRHSPLLRLRVSVLRKMIALLPRAAIAQAATPTGTIRVHGSQETGDRSHARRFTSSGAADPRSTPLEDPDDAAAHFRWTRTGVPRSGQAHARR